MYFMTTSAVLALPAKGVLVASPNPALREQVRQRLPDPSWPVQEVGGGADALAQLESGHWQALFLDRRLPDLDADELTEMVRRRYPAMELVVLDSAGELPGLAEVRLPAMEEEDELPQTTTGPTLPADVEMPPRIQAEPEPLPGMIGRTEAMNRVYQLARLVARRTTTVLILGPTGTGKELVARALHQLSPRAARPFVVVNCAAIPEALLESELFGHVRGAFTGAVQSAMGRIAAAQGGTLFLDEIGELPLSLQAKLLRFLDQREVQRLGTAEALRVDARVIAATNADLPRLIEEKRFRSDLYYRLSVFPLELPPLEKRAADVRPLAEHFLEELSTGSAGSPRLSPAACQLLEVRRWAGNVRELQQVMERAAILAEGSSVILPEHLYFAPGRRGMMASQA